MFIPPINALRINFKSDSDGSNQDVNSQEALENPSSIETKKAKTDGVEIEDFSERFDTNNNQKMDKNELADLGQYASKITNETNEEVHIGVSRTANGELDAAITTGDHSSVTPAYPAGTPVFSGHTHPSESLEASQADKDTRLDNGINVIWNPENGEAGYY
jgi:hypothetical protein